MLDTLREFSATWYTWVSQFGAQFSDPIGGLALQMNVPLISALLFGLLGSLAPCQMSANAGAIAYLSHRVDRGRRGLWHSTAAYLLGKILIYTLLGALAIVLGIRLPTWAMAGLRLAFGPMMIVFALVLLGVLRLRTGVGQSVSAWLERRLPGRGDAGAFLLGAAYSLSFCPTMALLFFGLLIPLGIQVPGPAGLVLPAVFAIGTAAPLLLFAAFLALGLGLRKDWLRGVRGVDRYLRPLAGTVFLLAGLSDTLVYWFM